MLLRLHSLELFIVHVVSWSSANLALVKGFISRLLYKPPTFHLDSASFHKYSVMIGCMCCWSSNDIHVS